MSDDGPRTGYRATRAAATGFVVSALASLSLAVVYYGGGQPQAEGALLAVALAGLGYGLVLAGHHLLPPGPNEEPRHPLASTPEERAEFVSDFERAGVLERRALFRRTLYLAAGALGVAAVFPIRSLGPNPGRSLLETPWRKGLRLVNEKDELVRADDVPVGGLVTVFPEGHPQSADGQAVVVRVDPATLTPPPGREDWSPDGLLVYSKVCTHAGCPVGLFDVQSHELICPCHQSAFDVLAAGKAVYGPAVRRLPQLPIAVDGAGFIVARGDFSEPVGPAWWTRP